MKVTLRNNVMVGGKLFRAREGTDFRPGPPAVHDLKEEIAKRLIEQGDATPVKEPARRAVDPKAKEAAGKAKQTEGAE